MSPLLNAASAALSRFRILRIRNMEPQLMTNPSETASRTTAGQRRKPAGEALTPSPEAIRFRAYELYLERNGREEAGSELADWLAAEREVLARLRGEALLKGDQE
jgi:hypothetical protein